MLCTTAQAALAAALLRQGQAGEIKDSSREDRAAQQLQGQPSGYNKLEAEPADVIETALVTLIGVKIAQLYSDTKLEKIELASQLAKEAMQVSYPLHIVIQKAIN